MHHAPRRAAAAAAVIVTTLLSLAACSSDDAPAAMPPGDGSGGSSSAPSSSPSASPPAPAGAAGRYVALGDSYTAAPGVGKATGPEGCFQTDANYPHLLAERLDYTLVDVSCSAATSENLTTEQALNVPPQLDALTADTALVTLGIGGNDEGLFSGLVQECAGPGAACRESARFAPDRLDAELKRLSARIAANVRAIEQRAPKARIVVVGYPQVLPASGACERLPIDAANLPFAHELNRRLDAAVRSGARSAGALVADVWTATRGHDACAADPWIAGAVPEGPAVPLHPYAAYEKAAADVVATVLAKG